MSLEFDNLSIDNIVIASQQPIFNADILSARDPFEGFVSLEIRRADGVEKWLTTRQEGKTDWLELELVQNAINFRNYCTPSVSGNFFADEHSQWSATRLSESIVRMVLEEDPNQKLINSLHLANDLIDMGAWRYFQYDSKYYKKTRG